MVIENNMSTKLVLTFCLLCCTAYGCSNAPNMLTEAAKHFDSQATPVFQAVRERKKIEVLCDSDFKTWIIEAWQHKVRLLKLLTSFVKEQDKEKV